MFGGNDLSRFRLRHAPLPAAATALIGGIALFRILPTLPGVWLLLALACASAAWFVRNAVAATALLLIAILLVGTSLAQRARYRFAADDIAGFAGDSRRLCEIELKLNESPRVVVQNFGQAHPLPPKQTVIADAVGVKTWNGWQPATGRVLVQIAEPHPLLASGQTVRALGLLDRPAPAMNPGQFDWADYYRQGRVLTSLHINHAKNLWIVNRDPPSLHSRWIAWTRSMLAEGFEADQKLDFALLRALVLGDPDPALSDVQDQFRATGTSHHLAVSGMHVAIVGGLVFLLMRLARVGPRAAWTAALLVVLAYGWAALPSPPVVRAVLIWVAFGVAVLGRRSVRFLHLMAATAIVMLILQPLDLLNAGFQLSFGTVLGLILLAGPMARLFGAKDSSQELLLERRDDHPIVRAAAKIDQQIILVLAASLTAWLVSMPLIAMHFEQLNPWAVFAGILLSPVVIVALSFGVLKIPLTAVWPTAAWLWADVARWPIAFMRWCVAKMSHWPYADVPLPAPPAWVTVLFYVALVLALWNLRPGVKVLSRLGFLLAMAALLILPYRTQAVQKSDPSSLRVTVLAVGAGECVVVEPPNKRVTLIDAGSDSLADPVRKVIAPFLRSRGITAIDTIVITNGDADHFGAVAELAGAYDVRQVLTAEGFEKLVARDSAGGELLQTLHDLQCPIGHLSPGQHVPISTDAAFDVLWPPKSALEMESNNQSLVLKLSYGKRSLLFTGDVIDKAMAALLESPAALKADVLVAPHHGSSELSTPKFVAAVDPAAIVSSNDWTLTQKQVDFEKMIGKRPLLRTNRSGAITIELSTGGQVAVVPLLGPQPGILIP